MMYTAMEVLEGECRMEQALIRDKRWRSLALLPISKNRQKYNVTKDSMNLLISILKEMNFQYIFIDCPAGIDVGFINAIAGANEAGGVLRTSTPPTMCSDPTNRVRVSV